MRRIPLILALALALIPILAVLIAGHPSRIYPVEISAWGASGKVFQMWGWLTAVVLFVAMMISFRKKFGYPAPYGYAACVKDFPTQTFFLVIETIFPFAVGIALINIIVVQPFMQDDFTCFRVCTQAWMDHDNPYAVQGLALAYPSAILYAYSGLFHVATWLLSFSSIPSTPYDDAWAVVFFFVQVIQWAGMWGMALLLVRFCRMLSFGVLESYGMAALTTFGTSGVWSALRYGQPVALIMCLLLGAILLAHRYQWLAGVLAGIGAAVKLYPAVLVWPWIWQRRWVSIGAFFLTVGLIFGWLIHPDLVREWWGFLRHNDPLQYGETAFRNNNTQGIIRNVGYMFLWKWPVIVTLQWVARGLILVWFGYRAIRRFRGANWCETLADALAFPLLMSPDIWDHSYIFAIPLWLCWTRYLSLRGKSLMWPMVLFLLMLGMPAISAFPFGYTRWVGLVMGMILTNPRRKN